MTHPRAATRRHSSDPRRTALLRLAPTVANTAASPRAPERCPVCQAPSNFRCCEYGRDR